MTELFILGFFLFLIASILYGLTSVKQSREKMVSQIQMMGVLNLILVGLFAYLFNLLLEANPSASYRYIFILLLSSLFVTIIGFSTSIYTNIDVQYKGGFSEPRRLGMSTNTYWLSVFFPCVLVLLGLFFYVSIFAVLP
jgi:uncharacterized membrane protein YczE